MSILITFLFHSNFGQVTITHSDSNKYHQFFDKEISYQANSGNKFLYYASLGHKLLLDRNFKLSNQYFEKALRISSEQISRHSSHHLDRYDDDHDVFMVLYFKEINYLSLGQIDEALVECRRMDELLRQVDRNHEGRKLVGQNPLIHMIMGIVYELGKEYDNSLISLLKAKSLFIKEHENSAGNTVPQQLLKDIDRVSILANQSDGSKSSRSSDLIFIWHNGQAPFKKDLHDDFKIKCINGFELVSDSSEMPKEDLIGNRILPFFIYSQPKFWSGDLISIGSTIKCELLEDATRYSVEALQERLKMEGIHVWKKGEDWNTLPSNIYYIRIPLNPGINSFNFIVRGYHGSFKSYSFSCDGNSKSYFNLVSTLDIYQSGEQ